MTKRLVYPTLQVMLALTSYIEAAMDRAVYEKLEDWILVGFHHRHILPIIASIDLNQPTHAHVEPVQTA